MRTSALILTVALLAACGRPAAVANRSSNLPASALTDNAGPVPAPPPKTVKHDEVAATTEGNRIPAALHGRWGLGPGDCTSTRGDAKGLLIVNAGELRFYESRAVPSPGIKTTAQSVSGNFAFNGEGQQWTKYETLELVGGKLIRTERDPLTSFTYINCG